MSIYTYTFSGGNGPNEATRNLQHPTIPTPTTSDAVDRWWATQRNH